MIERVQKKPCGGSFHFLFPDESLPRVEMGGVSLTTRTHKPHTHLQKSSICGSLRFGPTQIVTIVGFSSLESGKSDL